MTVRDERRHLPLALLATLIFAVMLIGTHSAWAQFGAGMRPPAIGGVAGWLLAKQAAFYTALAAMLRSAKVDGSAPWGLMGISFLYGIFHAAGPGHGKAVISSYLFANDETWRRGITLSFASAVMQSLTAISIVGVGAVLLGATAKLMGDTVKIIEIVSYGLIVLLGARLLWVKGYGFFGALSELRSDPAGRAADLETHGHAHCDHAHDDTSCHHHRHIITTMGTHPVSAATRSTRPAACPSTTTITATAITITARSWTYCHGDMPTARSLRSWLDQVAGSAAYPRSWPSVCGRAPALSSCSYSRSRRACFGPASPRPS